MSLPRESPFFPVSSDRLLLETGPCVAFLDAYPVSEGHTLVVPKIVVPSLYDLPESIQAELWETVRRVREMLTNRYTPAAFNIGLNDGPAAGQTVPHAHIHLIPRYEGDVPDPRGGVRWVLPAKAPYWDKQPRE